MADSSRGARGKVTLKFIPLIWAGIWRKRARSILILLQVLIAFTLFGILQGLNSGIKNALAGTHADRLYVTSRITLGEPVPMSLGARLEALPGIVGVSYRMQFAGNYQKASQNVAIVAVDPLSFVKMYPEVEVDPAAVTALTGNLSAAIVGIETARTFGWKVGTRVVLQSPLPRKDGARAWTFDLVGTYANRDNPDSALGLLTNYRYINEARAGGRDTVMFFVVKVDDPAHAPQMAAKIDALSANSPNETLTQSEHELAQSQISRIGDLDYIVHRIVAAAFAVLLFATGALMMQSIRERTPELAVLKTVGFGDGLVMVLILAETLALCLAGAAIGLGLASRILPLARAFIGIGAVHAIVVLTGLLFATILALAAGAIPAWRGLRLRVVDALADR